MRHFHPSPSSREVHVQARRSLQGVLDWKPRGRTVDVTALLDMLLLMAASLSSLYDVVRRHFGFSHETASKAVKANLPVASPSASPAASPCAQIAEGYVRALHDVMCLSRQERRRSWRIAIDTHYCPYYGKLDGEAKKHVVGGPKKQGTKWFFGYATAVLIHPGRRYTVAFCELRPKQKPHETVRILLDQIAQKGLKIQGAVLDSAFDSGETILLLQKRGLAYTIPLRRKGSGSNARNDLFEGKHRKIVWTEWRCEESRKQSRKPVRTQTVLWREGPKRGSRTMVFAFGLWSGCRACAMHQEAAKQLHIYARRFGIETSYRQKNQARAWTTSVNAGYRLLLEGLGHLLRQVWVALSQQPTPAADDDTPPSNDSKRTSPSNTPWNASLPLRRMMELLMRAIWGLYPEDAQPTPR